MWHPSHPQSTAGTREARRTGASSPTLRSPELPFVYFLLPQPRPLFCSLLHEPPSTFFGGNIYKTKALVGLFFSHCVPVEGHLPGPRQCASCSNMRQGAIAQARWGGNVRVQVGGDCVRARV